MAWCHWPTVKKFECRGSTGPHTHCERRSRKPLSIQFLKAPSAEDQSARLVQLAAHGGGETAGLNFLHSRGNQLFCGRKKTKERHQSPPTALNRKFGGSKSCDMPASRLGTYLSILHGYLRSRVGGHSSPLWRSHVHSRWHVRSLRQRCGCAGESVPCR